MAQGLPPLAAGDIRHITKDHMPLITLHTIDGNREIIEYTINPAYINYLHAPYGKQQGGAILRMHNGGGKATSSFTVRESFDELCTQLGAAQGFLQTTGRDYLAPDGFEGVRVAINADRVQTMRDVGGRTWLATFADGSERYFNTAALDEVNDAT
jgi:hypothetical protein